MRILAFLALFILFCTNLSAQTKEDLPCINKTFSIAMHIVIDSFGNSKHDSAEIVASVQEMNDYFAPICVSFEICSVDTIQNYWYVEMDENKRLWDEMQVLYNLKNRINIYYFNDIITPAGSDGFAGLGNIINTDSSGIVLQSALTRTITHEMGHYFGLEHTFETKSGFELVDGSNCLVAGDGICDTPADPYVNGDLVANYVTDECIFISRKWDANEDYYQPLVANVMSYYTECDCPNPTDGFTEDQYRKMAETYLSNPGMW